MAYLDKDKQKEANRLAAKLYRLNKRKGMTQQGMTQQGMTEGMTEPVSNTLRPANYGQPDCECRHCQNNRKQNNRLLINHGPYKTAVQLKSNEVNRQAMPGDADYEGVMRHEGGGGVR